MEYKWVRIADADERMVEEGQLLELNLSAGKVCLSRWEGRLYAFAHKCPHAGGFLSDGFVDKGGNVVCPLHRYRFNIRNGYNCSGEGYYLVTHPVELRADGIFIGFKHSSFWDFFKK